MTRTGKLTIVAFGSSTTVGEGASARELAYPARLEKLLAAALPGVTVTVINRGRGGEDAEHNLARLQSDVIAVQPDLVIWQVGANAAMAGHDPGPFHDRLIKGIAAMHAAGSDVVIMDNQRSPSVLAGKNWRAIEAAQAEAARTGKAGLFRRGALMDGWAAAGVPYGAFIHRDGVHHNDRGYDCLARALSTAIVAGLEAR